MTLELGEMDQSPFVAQWLLGLFWAKLQKEFLKSMVMELGFEEVN